MASDPQAELERLEGDLDFAEESVKFSRERVAIAQDALTKDLAYLVKTQERIARVKAEIEAERKGGPRCPGI